MPNKEEMIVDINKLASIIYWMSGSADFSPEGKAGKGWKKARTSLNKIIKKYPGRNVDGI